MKFDPAIIAAIVVSAPTSVFGQGYSNGDYGNPPKTTTTTGTPTSSAGAIGDPHIHTWDGGNFDFHGVCDLVLLENHDFRDGLGMDIQIRTKRTRQWSYISSAVLRIGGDMLEVIGGKDKNRFWVNGVLGDEQLQEEKTLEDTLSGYPIDFRQVNAQQREFAVDIGNEQIITLRTWHSFVRVEITNAKEEDFQGSFGLMGSFGNGARVGRDHFTILEDTNEFGQEWQVLASEPKLFHAPEGPQSPQRCELPSSTEMRRRLSQSVITQEEAQLACSRVSERDRSLCVFDVMAMNDLDVAGAY